MFDKRYQVNRTFFTVKKILNRVDAAVEISIYMSCLEKETQRNVHMTTVLNHSTCESRPDRSDILMVIIPPRPPVSAQE